MRKSVDFYVRSGGLAFGYHPTFCPDGYLFEVRSRLFDGDQLVCDELAFVTGREDGAKRLAELLTGQRQAGRSEGASEALGDVRKHFKAGHSEGFKEGMCKGVKLATQAAVDRCHRDAEEYAEQRHDEAEELCDVVQKRLNDALAQLGS